MKTLAIAAYLSIMAFSLNGDDQKMHQNQNPQYLYKVLSLRNWQATQNRNTVLLTTEDCKFIQFLKEDQIQEYLTKNGPDENQFVVLKIDISKLDGKLALESNPEEITQYFRLYDGFIPFHSISESKIVCRKHTICCNIDKINIVEVGDSVLRKPARDLSIDEILSPEIQELIETMKDTMRAAPGVGLAAPQIILNI